MHLSQNYCYCHTYDVILREFCNAQSGGALNVHTPAPPRISQLYKDYILLFTENTSLTKFNPIKKWLPKKT